jgi:hypothetical protein
MNAKLVSGLAVTVTAVAAVAVIAGQAAAAAPRTGQVTAVLHSPDLAGYAATPSKLISARATIKIPSITCASSGDSGIAPGVYLYGGYGAYSGAFASEFCQGGQVTYDADITINGAQTTVFAVKPGNTLVVSISQTVGQTSATIRDVTTGRHTSLSGATSDKTEVLVGDGGEFFGGLSLSQLGGVPRFKGYPISSVSVGGQALGSVHPVRVERFKRSTLQLLPTTITAGHSFTMEFKHA